MNCPVILQNSEGQQIVGYLGEGDSVVYYNIPDLSAFDGDLNEFSASPSSFPQCFSKTDSEVALITSEPESDSLLSNSKELPSNNVLVLDGSPSGSGTYPGITMVSRNDSCQHIHYSYPDDCWCAELDMNGPTREWSIRIGDDNPNGRKRRRFIVNKEGQFWLGKRDNPDNKCGDFDGLGDQIAHPGQAQLEVHSNDNLETLSQIRATVDYDSIDSGNGASVTGGLTDEFYINQWAIKPTYNGNWSSDLAISVRDTTSGEDKDDNFRGLVEIIKMLGTGSHLTFPAIQDFPDDATAAASLPPRTVYSIGSDLRITA